MTQLLCWMIAVASLVPLGQDKETTPKPAGTADQAALEKEFEQMMSGVVLIGRYTVTSTKEADKPAATPREDRYTIQKVSKLNGGLWLFQARIQYGDRDVTLPLPLQVKWAGDTPVISVTDLAIPSLGTYTARVMIYRGQYAGTWSGGDHGGHMWGRIEKLKNE